MSEPLLELEEWTDDDLLPLVVKEGANILAYEMTEDQARDLERQLHERLAERD